MRRDFADWLRGRGYGAGTTATQTSRLARVEAAHGDLDGHFAADGLDARADALRYSAEDERRGRPNPSLIPLDGTVLRANLASYRSSVCLYRAFLSAHDADGRPGGRRGVRRPPQPDAAVPRADATTLRDFVLDGLDALEAVIAQSRYGTIEQAVASLALFSHPRTVEQTGARGVFPTVRDQRRVGERAMIGGRKLMFDDNRSPTQAFLWANGLTRRGRDTQFNHVYTARADPDAYTSLANICMTPAFVAKLTDTSRTVRDLLRFRSYDLYGWAPAGVPPPERPPLYDGLHWAEPMPPTPDVAAVLAEAMGRKPKDRTVVAARDLGWLFGEAP